MRKNLIALVASLVLLVSFSGTAAASDGWSVDIQSARLLAKGAAVEVSFDTVCPASTPSYYSALVKVSQRVNRNLIASGSLTMYYTTLQFICDGSTVTTAAGLVPSDTGVAYKNGVALVTVTGTPGSMVPTLSPVMEEIKLGK